MSHLGDELSALVDGELGGAELDRANAHLAACGACRVEANALRRLKHELHALAEVHDSDEITGHVEATETVELRARVSGHLDSVHFQAGQLVKAGDLLFTIDPRWYRAQFDLATARAEVA